jgi:DNA-binding IclR family transcriptional regulator
VTPTKVASRYTTPALEKGLDILELFASEPAGLTKSDVARQLGRTASEVFRMLLCLEDRGYISRSRDNERFRLTLRLFKLAQEHPPTRRLTNEALPIMQQVAHELSQSCHLAVLDRGQVVVIAQVGSPLAYGFYVKTGTIMNVMHSATGQVILAHQTSEVCSQAIQVWRRENNARVPRDLNRQLARIKEHGYEERKSDEIEGITNITFPVLNERGYALAALTVPYLQRIGDETSPARVKRVLKQGSALLSNAMCGIGTDGDEEVAISAASTIQG